MSRPDRQPTVAVDFAPPRRRAGDLRRPIVALAIMATTLGALGVVVTQLLLR